MFCSKCGKKIDYDAVVCNECSGTQGFFANEDTMPTIEEKPKTSRNLGLGGAIAGAVLGYIALAFGAVGMCYAIIGAIMKFTAFEPIDPDVTSIGAIFLKIGIVFSLITLIFAFISLSKGVKSIKLFKASRPRPIATLVLGIMSLDYSVASLLFIFMGFIYSFFFVALLSLPM